MQKGGKFKFSKVVHKKDRAENWQHLSFNERNGRLRHQTEEKV
jgi:hypothetical protein